MPVSFLTPEIEATYGRFDSPLTPAELAKAFHFDDGDRRAISPRKGERAQLGFALQLGTVRHLGAFCDPRDVPIDVVAYVSQQLSIGDPGSVLSGYASSQTRWAHMREIRRRYGYRELHDPERYFRFVRWLYTRAWIRGERPSVLFEVATSYLRAHKVLLPGISTLERLVSRVREKAAIRLWRELTRDLEPGEYERLDELLRVTAPGEVSPFDRLRKPPTSITIDGLTAALDRVRELRKLGVGELDFSRVPDARILSLARYASAARAQAVERRTPLRRAATLVAFARETEIQAIDDALSLFDQLVAKRLSAARSNLRAERMSSLQRLDRAAVDLRAAVNTLLTSTAKKVRELQDEIFGAVSPERLAAAVEIVDEVVKPPHAHKYEQLVSNYQTFNGVLRPLFTTLGFKAVPEKGDHPVLRALHSLVSMPPRTRILTDEDVPAQIASGWWKKAVRRNDGRIDRKAFTVCAVERLRHNLRRRQIFVPQSRAWGDPRELLLDETEWARHRDRVCRALGHDLDPTTELTALSAELDDAYKRTVTNLPTNTAVRIEGEEPGRLVVSQLDAMDEPESLLLLRDAVGHLLPRVDLPDVLLEVDSWTRFTSDFRHVSEADSRAENLAVSISAVLIVEACNLGLEPVISPGEPALTQDRLRWVDQNYIRAETLRAANARLVDYQTKVPVTECWGGGEVASADGMRFVVPVRSLHAGPNPKYFKNDRGVTYYNYSSKFAGFHGIVVPGTLRDSIYVLDGMLEHQTALEPCQLIADSAAYSDLVFGLFRLLTYLFSPRLADIGRMRFWRFDTEADYGALNSIARNSISVKRIVNHWDDMLRAAGSLLLGKLSASQLIRALQAGGRPTPLGRAIAEYGRAPKTIHMLGFIDDETYRRSILGEVNRIEKRHDLGRVLFHGKKGELRQPYKEGQEDQLGSLGLVINAIVLWNTRYIDAAVAQLREDGFDVRDEDVARLSPLRYEHINLHGRYHFRLPRNVKHGALRELGSSV